MKDDRVYTVTRYEYGPGLIVSAKDGDRVASLVVTSECQLGAAIKQVDHILGDHIRCIESTYAPLNGGR